MSEEKAQDLRQLNPLFGLGSQFALGSQFGKTIWEELLEVIESKNSWGKNELKDEILKLLAKKTRC